MKNEKLITISESKHLVEGGGSNSRRTKMSE